MALDDALLVFSTFGRYGNGMITIADLKAATEVMGMAMTAAQI